MSGERWPLSDLSFFRFPEVTADVVRNIVWLVVLLALTVLLTVLVHRWLQRTTLHRRRRAHYDRFASETRMDPGARAVLERLMAYAGAKDEFAFVQDAEAYELAVERVASEGDPAELAHLTSLRRSLHLNVMNPEIALVSTRQLLEDLPVRLVANIGEEKLDLYCALLKVDEQELLIDLPQEDEVIRLLADHPNVFLLFWREREGEAMFRLRLEVIEAGSFPALRARHAFRDREAEQRTAFRLSLDEPVQYRFLQRRELGRRRGQGDAPTRSGTGRLIDLSYGGASLIVAEALEERGLAQLQFALQGRPVSMMLEVLTRTPMTDGRFLVRGQFRGLGEEARVRLHNVLYREQIKRLREKELLHIRPGA